MGCYILHFLPNVNIGKIEIGQVPQKSLVKMGKMGVIEKYYFKTFEAKPLIPARRKRLENYRPIILKEKKPCD